ncbi:MAG: T9SS type A sorting domain-containing protein [Bacteroidota bacterium]|nr:T9SS type A sorting domain-containing protein [Bacteroidota bacterium]MDP4233570.1 T9SS type A sorting domain-containing protein [Bacteroidota bacterium]MDP4243656.1 T9SS type A sorting domain-containing protein [Bacteroidota bacterium]MDP4287756.1 T9SS type A sorting domain-containing protein [Bacteroidota bacterium]
MKRLFAAVILLLVSSLTASPAEAQMDTCLALWQDIPTLCHGIPHDTAMWMNPDSLKFDTCSSDTPFYYLSGATMLHSSFARKDFQLTFRYYVLADTGVPVGDTVYRSWKDIDTKYLNIRNALAAIERRFGTFTLWRTAYTEDDTSWFTRREWDLIFDRYVYADTIVNYLSNVPGLDSSEAVRFYGSIRYFTGVAQNNITSAPRLWPVPCDRELFISGGSRIGSAQIFDALGRAATIQLNGTSDPLSFDVSTWEPGIYYLRIDRRLFRVLILH